MLNYLLQETGDALLQENGYYILLDDAASTYLWISDTSYGTMRLDSFSFTEAANQGEVGVGGFRLDDDDLTASVPALKPVTLADFRASAARIFTGYTHNRTTQRGPSKVAGQREWDVEVADVNTLADDYVITDAEGGNRGVEWDWERVEWLIASTAFGTAGGITAGVVPHLHSVSMAAADCRYKKPREVLSQCSEAAGKLWFVYNYTGLNLLYYDIATGTSLTSSASISDVLADVDSATVWAPSNVTVKRSPDNIYSAVYVTYSAGTVVVSNPTIASNYRTREIAVSDTSITDVTFATDVATALLYGSTAESIEIDGLSIVVPAANVNDIRAGQRVQIKLIRHGISSYAYYRVIRRAITSLGADHNYRLTLGLASNVLSSVNRRVI